jgi:hypothetical protein
MADYYNLVPGYVVRPERYGPDVFLNVGGLSWTDQQGLSRGWGTTFLSKAGISNWFPFPKTNPTILAGVLLRCNLAAVTLNLQVTDAFLRAVHVWDRVNRFAEFNGLNVTGDFSNTWIPGQNVFTFPDHLVDGAVGISVLVFFDSNAEVTFTGAGLKFHD